MKIIKYSFIAGCAALLLPAPPPSQIIEMQGGTRVNLETGEVLSAAASAYSDVTGFCQRQPEACSTAGNIFSSLEVRAKYNFQRLYEWSTSKPAAQGIIQQPPSQNIKSEQSAQLEYDPIITGSTNTMIVAASSSTSSVNTLNIEDLVPEWRGPTQTSTG